MNGKYFVGRRVVSFEKFNPEAPVTGVRLLLDDENGFEAGDMDGNVWEMENPYATQAMADNILASLAGKTYTGFTASAAPLGPEAELGDGVTVNGLYSMLAYQNVTFGPGHMSEIAAPGDDEPEEEYKYVSQKQREETRELGKVRSLIAKTASQIRLEVSEAVSGLSTTFDVKLDGITGQVSGLDGRVSTVEQTATGLTSTVQGLDGKYTTLQQTVDGFNTTVQGLDGKYTSLQQTVDGFTFKDAQGKVWINKGNINLTGAITWDDLNASAQSAITSNKTRTFNTQPTSPYSVGDLYYSSNGYVYRCTTARTDTGYFSWSDWTQVSNAGAVVNSWKWSGNSTYIDGSMVGSPVVAAMGLYGEQIGLIPHGDIMSGYIEVQDTSTGAGIGLWSQTGGMRICSAGNLFLSAYTFRSEPDPLIYGGQITMTQSAISVGRVPLVHGSKGDLGTADHLWGNIYSTSSTITVSDRNRKHDIEPLPDKYADMVDILEPVRFKYDDGTSGRYHVGFIAQSVKAAMDELGIDSTEFGGYVEDVDEEGKPIFMLRHEEFDGIIWAVLRKVLNRLNALEARYGY